MSGYIFMENMNKHDPCKSATQKFRLLCLTYNKPRDIRYDKGPQFSKEFEDFLQDIKIEPTTSSARKSLSNGLAKAAVKSAKMLLRKSIKEKTSNAETLCHFNQSLCKDGYSLSELSMEEGPDSNFQIWVTLSTLKKVMQPETKNILSVTENG